jgi:acyl carrier protein
MNNTKRIQDELFGYVKANTFKETDSLRTDTMLFTEGILDSMGFVLLLDFLESTFKITPLDSDLIEENFESIDAITAYIQAKSSTLVE